MAHTSANRAYASPGPRPVTAHGGTLIHIGFFDPQLILIQFGIPYRVRDGGFERLENRAPLLCAH